MAVSAKRIAPCLWFDTQAEDAANFYVSIFPNSKIGRISRYGNEGQEIHGKTPGSVMVVEFELNGAPFTGLNGGPQFNFDEAVSFQIPCDTQEEIDYFSSKLTADGGSQGPCGWVKDRFGLSWQVNATVLADMLAGQDRAGADRVTKAFLQMKKFDIAALEKAYSGA